MPEKIPALARLLEELPCEFSMNEIQLRVMRREQVRLPKSISMADPVIASVPSMHPVESWRLYIPRVPHVRSGQQRSPRHR